MAAEKSEPRLKPWAFVPLLYFLQAIPVSLVQDVSTIVYKDLGIANESITRWTSLIALPWSLQLLLGPLVDLSGTKRQWVMRCQMFITFALMAAPFALRMPGAFELSLGAFLVAAIFSALCNTAMDGFYLLSMPKDEQAKFVGVQTTCYRLGTLFAKGFLVFLAGLLMSFPSMQVAVNGGSFALRPVKDAPKTTHLPSELTLKVTAGELTDDAGTGFTPAIRIPDDINDLFIDPNGQVNSGGRVFGSIVQPGASVNASSSHTLLGRRDAWAATLFLGAVLYGLLYLLERKVMPRPSIDVLAEEAPGEMRRNIVRTLTVVTAGLSGYFAANAIVRLTANAIWSMRDGASTGPLKGWMLADTPKILGFQVGDTGVQGEIVQLVLAGAIFVFALAMARASIKGTQMGAAFGSYFRQPGIAAILAFLMFYRFGEAMVSKMSPLFLKDSIAAGGLGLSTELVGTIKGVVGVFGIVLGGLAGGWVVSKFGLRKSFWPIAICMHLPNLLYLWASISHPPYAAIYGVDFCEQFGYGFGFAGYIVYQMRVAQRGNFRTAHYALGVGIGATFIQVAGILSGVLQANLGYTGFFIAALVMGIPGLLTLLFIPLDEGSEAQGSGALSS